MSAPAARAPHFVTTLAPHAWWIVLLAALVLLWVATARRIDRVDAISSEPTWSVDAPQRDAASPTGFKQGQRQLIVPGHHHASFWWIMEAQLAAEQGSLRLRHIGYDAQPEGRDIRRTAPYRWWLIATGWLYGAVHGEPLGYSIERGALIADPLLLALLLVVGAFYCARTLGTFAAIGLVVGGISLFPLAANFQPGAPDPHSLAWVLALGSVLPLLAAFRPGGIGTQRRVHFVVAGVFGGLGFWNDATTQMPVLLAIFFGALGWEFARARGAAKTPPATPARGPLPARGELTSVQAPPAPSHWRAWAMTGAITVVAAGVFEFAPNAFSWSLDSVNPIHAVAWWGLGEALRAAGIWCREGRKAFDRRALAVLGAAGLAIAAWPATGILSGSGALLATDVYALELANHPHGGFAAGLKAWLHKPGTSVGAIWATLLPCALLLVLAARIGPGRIDREGRGRLVFVLVATVFAAVLACFQLRWWNLVDVLVLIVLAALFAEVKTSATRARWGTLGAAGLVLPGLFVGFPPAIREKPVNDISPLETRALIARDFSYWLAKRAGPEPTVVFSTPVFSDAVAFYGGCGVVVSSDDKNQQGHLAAIRIAAASTEQEALVLLNSRGITHLALPLWDPMLDQLVRIGRKLPAGQDLPQDAFAVALQWWEVPLWMRPMDYLIPKEERFQGFELRAFALQAEQEPDLGLSRLADFFVERGQLEEAKSLREALTAYPRSVFALGAIANVDFAVRDGARLKDSLDVLISQLSRRAARNLPADRRLSLAALLLQTNHADRAREQMTACFEGLDAATLRTLTPGAVVNLVALSRSLGMPFPDAGLEAVAMELMPPRVRARFTPE